MSSTTDIITSWTIGTVIICFEFSAILTGLLLLHQSNLDKEDKMYSLTFKDDLTTFDIGNGKLSLTAQNSPSYPHVLNIYGLGTYSNGTETMISSSDLSNQAGDVIEETKIELDPQRIPYDSETAMDPKSLGLSISDSKQAGTFNGYLLMSIGQKITSIPLVASTQPLQLIAIGWVVVGAAASIGLWEIIRFFNNKKNEAEESKLRQEIDKLTEEVKESTKSIEELRSMIEKLKCKLEKIEGLEENSKTLAKALGIKAPMYKVRKLSSGVTIQDEESQGDLITWKSAADVKNIISEAMRLANEVEEKAKSLNDDKVKRDFATVKTSNLKEVPKFPWISEVNEVRTKAEQVKILSQIAEIASDDIAEKETHRQNKLQTVAETNMMAAATVKAKIVAANERLANKKQRTRVAIIDIVSAGFGITVALTGVLSNTFVTNLQIIGELEILTLFGIGLGVGSLKEIVDRG
jgi:hypothetical protein